MFCRKCGRIIEDIDKKCPHCGTAKDDTEEKVQNAYIPSVNNDNVTGNNNNNYEPVRITPYQTPYSNGDTNFIRKSRLTAGLLQIFLGSLGVGRFYLGYVGWGFGQIAASIVSCGLAGMIWGIVDGILILSGKVEQDARGVELDN